METIEKTISCNTQMTAVELIAEATKLSKSKIKRTMTLGAVWTSKRKKITRLRRVKTQLQPGDRILGVTTIIRLGSGRLWHEIFPLVKANGMAGHAAFIREFANIERFHSCTSKQVIND